eukprot:12764835-Heterocapsa_arctica.AAC.1
MLAQNIGRNMLFGTFGALFGTSSLSPLKSSQTAHHFCTNSELERTILSLKHTLYRLVRNSSAVLFGTFGTQKCPEHVRN